MKEAAVDVTSALNLRLTSKTCLSLVIVLSDVRQPRAPIGDRSVAKMEEKRALLYKDSQSPYSKNEDESHRSSTEGSDEWWEDSHSSCSSCCDSNSGLRCMFWKTLISEGNLSRKKLRVLIVESEELSIEWETEIKANGELFYIVSELIGASERDNSYEYQKSLIPECEEKASKLESMKRGNPVNWMRRRDIKKLQLKEKSESDVIAQSQSQFHRISASETNAEGNKEFKEVTVKIDSICGGQTLCEKLLGLKLSPLNNDNSSNEATVINIDSTGPTRNCKDLSVGDILHSINNFNVTVNNVEGILESLNFPTEVLLRIKKSCLCEELKNSKHQSGFVKSLLKMNESLEGVLQHQPVGIVVVDMESQNLNKDDVVYSYPEKCALSSCRGAFVTLFHLIREINPNDECQSSRIIMKKQPTHVLYKSENNFLLLIAVPVKKCTLSEATFIVTDLIRNLLFSHQTLKRCFETSEKLVLDQFFSIFFTRILTNGFSSNASQFLTLEYLSSSTEVFSVQFEDILPEVVWVPLPKEAQIQIDDALNELEANDVDNEEENFLSSQRFFNIIGSCLFHKGYLLVSHLPKEDLLDVYTFCRQNCLIQLFRNETVKSMIIWREVFPQSVHRGLPMSKFGSYPLPNGKWFLLIVGQLHDMLAVILEAGNNCVKLNRNPGPSVAYVEEAMDTLKHLQKLGISNLASQWIDNNSRFKTATPEEMFARKTNRKKENLLGGFVKSFEGNSRSSGLNISSGSSKSSDTNPAKRTRGLQQDTSEDSVSQTASNISEVSDENAPILGRRAERGRVYSEQASDSDSSSSDWDSSRDSNMRESVCSSGADNFYLGDIGEIIPAKLTTGPDYLLFNYIHLDGNDGVLVNPPLNSKRSTPKMLEVIQNFRRCAQIIHSVFEYNIKFKKNSQDSSKGYGNKSLISVKEQGVLLECFAPESDSHKKPLSFTYWTVGRLFFTPQPREVYVCYYDDAPQNLVEIAFRLGLSVAG